MRQLYAILVFIMMINTLVTLLAPLLRALVICRCNVTAPQIHLTDTAKNSSRALRHILLQNVHS